MSSVRCILRLKRPLLIIHSPVYQQTDLTNMTKKKHKGPAPSQSVAIVQNSRSIPEVMAFITLDSEEEEAFLSIWIRRHVSKPGIGAIPNVILFIGWLVYLTLMPAVL
jgi:hypothetical protein